MVKYDTAYYYNLLRIHASTAKLICGIRWDLLNKNIPGIKTVLDYGCGVGFFKAFGPAGIDVDTYDIMPVVQTGITKPRYDVLTMWDVLEHIPDFTDLELVLKSVDYVAITLPVKPDGKEWNAWKHFKPGEHLHYYTTDLLCALFRIYGFELKIETDVECPPREDIRSYIFKRGTL